MRVKNSLTPQTANVGKEQSFAVAISDSTFQRLIAKSVPDAASVKRLTGALISIVSANEKLQQCSTMSIVAAALRGEGMGLTLGREYYVVPYGNMATYILGYKGLLALLIATGEVADTDCVEVRQGEYKGRDRRTKRPSFDFSVYETDEDAEKHPIIGYYAYVEMKSGYFRGEYMSVGDILDHAERYSKAFDRAQYNKLVAGELTPKDADALKSKSPWYGSTETMMRKTVIRKLLNSGYIRLSNSAELNNALAVERNAEDGLIPELSINQETGEVIEGTAEVVEDADKPKYETSAGTRTQKASSAPVVEGAAPEEMKAMSDDDFTAGFFGGRK